MRTMLNSGLRASNAHRPRRYAAPATEPVTEPQPPVEPVVTPDPAPEPVVVPEDKTKVKDLQDWVGADPARAQAVLDREKAQSYQRPTVITGMEAIVAQHDLI
jgi:hypothetical protein